MEHNLFRASTIPLATAVIVGAVVLRLTGDIWYASMAVVGTMAAAAIIASIFCDVVTLLAVDAGLAAIAGVAALPLAPLALWVAVATIGAFFIALVLALVAGDMAKEEGAPGHKRVLALQAAPLGIGTLVGILIGGYICLHCCYLAEDYAV